MAQNPLYPQAKTGKDIKKHVKNILTALVKAAKTSSLLYLGKKDKMLKLQPI